MKISEITGAINEFAPLSLQESWDNSGVQVGCVATECSGALLCVDVKPEIIREAIEKKCNLIISHHPLIFKGLKHICPDESQVQESVYLAISNGITVFSSHTALDSASEGISRRMALMLGAKPLQPLVPAEDPATGLGCVGELDSAMTTDEFVRHVKKVFKADAVRCSRASTSIKRIALCGGSGGEFIPMAIAAGCDAYVTADVRYHDFVDHGHAIFIADIGHFESEECSKEIFYRIISEKFHNFAVYKSETEKNPIKYI